MIIRVGTQHHILEENFTELWGDFDVNIKIDKDYIVAASGYIEKSDPSNTKLGIKSGNKRIWNFKAEGS